MFQSMEFLTITNLMTLVLLIVLMIWKCCWIIVLRPLLLSRRFKKQGISGPKYTLLYGNIQEIKKMKIEANLSVLDPNTNDIFPRVYPYFQQWMSQYGETFLYWNGTEPTLCVSNPELAKQILSSKLGFSVIPKRRPEILIYFGRGLSFIEGVDWVRHRRILNPAFSIDRVKAMTKSMVDCTLRMFEKWEQKNKDEETEQNEIKMEMYKEFHELTADIIATTAFGSSYIEGIEIFKAQIELRKTCVTSATKVFTPGTQYLPTPLNLQIWKLDRKIKNMIKGIIAMRLQSSNYGDDFLGIMLNAATSEDAEKKISIDEIIEECKTFFISGHGLTSILLTWTTMLLSLHQDWQEKLREEVFKHCSKDKIPDSDTFSKLKLMRLVIMESLRMYGPLIKMFREATQDMKIGHLYIPKGTNIIIPLLKIHNDKTVWGEDADKFNPLRFANGVSEAANHPNAFLAFSIGQRACIGENFAIMEAKIVLTMILQRFRLSLSGEYKHAPVDHISLKPQFGLPVMFKPL